MTGKQTLIHFIKLNLLKSLANYVDISQLLKKKYKYISFVVEGFKCIVLKLRGDKWYSVMIEGYPCN